MQPKRYVLHKLPSLFKYLIRLTVNMCSFHNIQSMKIFWYHCMWRSLMKYIFFIITLLLTKLDCENCYIWGGDSAPRRYVRISRKSFRRRYAKLAMTKEQTARWHKCVQSTSRGLQLCNTQHCARGLHLDIYFYSANIRCYGYTIL
jgi:hypothetical protein